MQKSITSIFKILISGLVSLSLLLGGGYSLYAYFIGGDKDEIAMYQEMLDDNTFVTGIFDGTHEQTTIKVGSNTAAIIYELPYTYEVDGIIYHNIHKQNTLPTGRDVQVYYLKTDPSKSIINIESKLKILEGIKGDTPSLYWGIILVVIGLIISLAVLSYVDEYKINKLNESKKRGLN